jgi:polyhydroxyalkanoate synthase subunit PhaC
MIPHHPVDPMSAMLELVETGTRAANATRMLGRVRDRDVDVATTPKEEVHRIGSKVLYRFTPQREKLLPVPVLVIYALVGRYTVLDLQEDRSFLRNLVDGGLDVYVVDWGHPGRGDHLDDLGDYVELYLDEFVDVICERHDVDAINLFGICQGGVLSLCHAALHPEKIRNLLLGVTPVDFHGDLVEGRPGHGFMNVWARSLEREDIDLMVDALGNLPGDIGGIAFSMMTPLRSLTKYNLTLVEVGQNEAKLMNFLRMEKWLADRPAHTGAAARQWLNDLYKENLLIKGEFTVDGQKVDLGNITMPVLNIYTETDHIIPPRMTTALEDHVGTEDYTALPVKGGHIGVFVSGRAQKQVQENVVDWLKSR